MNIYFTGSHGTGKTTTARLLSSRLGYSIVPSVSRNSPHEPKTIDHQRYVMEKVVYRTMMHTYTVQERTPVDVFAYTKLMGMKKLYRHQQMCVDRFLRNINHAREPIFYFPIHFELENDGVRPDEHAQEYIDKEIILELERARVNYHVIPDASPEKRVDFILERINKNAKV